MSIEIIEKAQIIRNAVPEEGLFDGKDWLVSPEPFPVPSAFADELEKLGHRLHLFVRACNLLYFQSVKGKQPRWIAELLDRGKPPELVAEARRLREEIPAVIRPDLILTDDGFAISELDSVPGGIGLTGWLNQTYAQFGYDILGGADGMIEGYRSITPGGADIVVSDESTTYRPEMRWLAARLNERFAPEHWRVLDGSGSPAPWQPNVYRFLELFDLPNIPCSTALREAVGRGETRVTPSLQAVPGRKTLVCPLLAAAAAGILASGIERAALPRAPKSDPLHLAGRSHAVAAQRRAAGIGSPRLE